MTIKTRFCPSPTGYMHLGNARTALFNALLAKQHNGIFLLRIEDTDLVRSQDIYSQALFADLRWLGLDWQEGPGLSEDSDKENQYWQSRRQTIYDHYYQILLKENIAYVCFCTEEQLAFNRKIQRVSGKPPRYPGTCRHLSQNEITINFESGKVATLRFRVPENTIITFDDLVKGSQRFLSDDMGDFIIRRADGTPAFLFANAIDDSLMEVTHALRGDDHLTNTPRQLLIQQTLNLTSPRYGHIALILGNDGAPLSKRNGSSSIRDLRDSGYLPLAINNYLGRLGHYYESNDLLSLAELSKQFQLNNLGSAPAHFDDKQLLRWQKLAVEQTENSALIQWLHPILKSFVPTTWHARFAEVIKPNIVFPQDAKKWAENLFAEHLEYTHDNLEIFKTAGINYFQNLLELVNEVGLDYAALITGLKQRLKLNGKALFLPLRIVLTGEGSGPELVQILPLIGIDRVKRRIEAALYSV